MTANPNRGRNIGSRLFWSLLCVGSLGFILSSGCTPTVPGQSAGEQEPHFILGENRINGMNYRGAVQAFEEVLEVDPHSAAAHFQLGWLYDSKVPDPAAAIYHYEKYLELEPDASNAAVVKQRIHACKQRLAADVLGLPSMPGAQQQIERLMTRIEQLREENRQLQAENRQLQAGLKRWSAYVAGLQAAKSNSPAPIQPASFATSANRPSTVQTAEASAVAPSAALGGSRAAGQASGMTMAWRTHTVVAGETAVRIARHYRISLGALLAANPGLEPRRMPVGLILKIPPPRNSGSPFLVVRP